MKSNRVGGKEPLSVSRKHHSMMPHSARRQGQGAEGAEEWESSQQAGAHVGLFVEELVLRGRKTDLLGLHEARLCEVRGLKHDSPDGQGERPVSSMGTLQRKAKGRHDKGRGLPKEEEEVSPSLTDA